MQEFAASRPEVEDYARFRAMSERQRRPWPEWPPAARDGQLRTGDYEEGAAVYHLLVQQALEQQLDAVAEEGARQDCGLYLDLPIGVHPHGYDAWRHRDLYLDAAVGSPPDAVFTRGQNWGLPPLHPQAIREQKYAHLRAVLAASMSRATRLRVDHIFGFQRLFVIPSGREARDGVYVQYRTEEILATAILESHRCQCELIGENLGTAPPGFNRKLRSHRIAEMWVAPYELEPGRREALRRPPRRSLAALNTHDMPMLAAWWEGEDIDDRQRRGWIDEKSAAQEKAHRHQAIEQLREWLRACGDLTLLEEDRDDQLVAVLPLLRALALSDAKFVLVNLEDLWLERSPQNVPSAPSSESWRRRARYALEEFAQLPEVREALSEVDVLRKSFPRKDRNRPRS